MTVTWFDACFRERYPALVQVLHGITRERAAAEDLAQEAFVRLWSKGPVIRPDADYWVMRVGRNLALDELRRDKRRERREVLRVETDEGPRFGDDEIARVRAVVEELAPRDREVLMLRAFGGLPLDQIGRIVGRKTNAVKQDLFRARERLRRLWFAEPGGIR